MKKYFILFVTVLLALSCNNNNKSRLLVDVREVDFVNKSDVTIKGVPVDAELPMGVVEMAACDSFMLVLSRERTNALFVYNDDFKLIGRFCSIGRGRNEFLTTPGWSAAQILRNAEGDVLMPFVDSMNGGLKLVNLQKSLKTQSTVIDERSDYRGVNVLEYEKDGHKHRLSSALSYVFLDNNKNHIFEKYSPIVEDGQVYSELSYTVTYDSTQIKQFKLLADFEANDENYTGGRVYKHPDRNLIVNPFLYLDYILFFDLDNDRTFAIHQPGSLSFEEKLPVIPIEYDENGFELYVERTNHFFRSACADSFFMVTYYANNALPELLFFDWDGNFLKSIKLDTHVSNITYDERKQILYGLDGPNDRIISFDLSQIVADFTE